MELMLVRTYGAAGVNGRIYLHDQQICSTIELPWKNNQPQISCIPEGSYPVSKRYSPRFEWHLHVQDVPGRSMILIHPANHAIKELRGCIAPVTQLTGTGTGIGSRSAMQLLFSLTDETILVGEQVILTIISEPVQ